MRKILISVFFLLTAWSVGASAIDYPGSFDDAKRKMWQVYKDNRYDQYCGCPLGSRNAPDLKACGFESRKNAKRAARTEVEHVVPAEHLGRQFACWKEGGRAHCNATDTAFQNAHNDMHNLIPVVGEVNGDRSNFRFDELAAPYGQYGQCQFKVDFSGRRAEPPPSMKGDIARIHFYMRDQHGLRLSAGQERLFQAWSKMDPVSEWERVRNKRIAAIQGNGNPYVEGVADSSPAVFEQAVAEPMFQASAKTSQASAFDCSRKTCKAMTSCAEAMHKLQVCGHRSLDGNSDGVPCEAICR